MLCNDLQNLKVQQISHNGRVAWHISNSFTPASLLRGSTMHEPKVRPGCKLGSGSLDILHSGKDAAILNLLCGGNGYAHCHYTTDYARSGFDIGIDRERKDLLSMQRWASSFAQCEADRKRGATA